MKKILIIEDDMAIAEIERDFLKLAGYEVTLEADGHKGLQEAFTNQYSLILLDLMLPGIDGYEICRQIRGEISVPILMVTARTTEIDKVKGLGLGADDYISKPFSPTELVARVNANIAQFERLSGINSNTDDSTELHVGSLRLNPKTRRVYIGETEIDLKNKEFELLFFLVSNPDIVFSKDHLYETIWGIDAYGDTKTVAVHINRLREKIERDPQNPVHIQTVWGAGYRFAK